ncbi:MAG: type II secretion system F family protein [Proteobacteria bacterium]|nr:type II secretion system F family protein [Pseudomonadota bacterium]
MITIGFFTVWIVLVWVFHKHILFGFEYIQTRDKNRLKSLQHRLHQNFIFKERQKIQKYSRWVLLTGILLSAILRSVPVAVLFLAIYLIFPTLWIRSVELIRKKKFNQQLILMIPMLSSMLRSGHGLEKSLSEIRTNIGSPMSEEIHFMLKEMQLGATMEESLEKLVQRFHSENLLTLVHAIGISRKLGTSLSEAMDHISENVLQKEKLKHQIQSLTAQGKMQSYMAVAMPFMIGLALKFISPNYFDPLFGTTIGHIAIAYCLLSMGIGLFWIRKITTKEYL